MWVNGLWGSWVNESVWSVRPWVNVSYELGKQHLDRAWLKNLQICREYNITFPNYPSQFQVGVDDIWHICMLHIISCRLTSPPAGAVCYKHSTTRLRSRRSQRALIIAHAYELFIPRTADYIAKIFLTMGKYDNLKVKQLQKELAKRNARQTGKKKTLIKL